MSDATGQGTDDPWVLKSPPGTSVYMPPLLEALGPAEVEQEPRNNRMRVLDPLMS